MSDLPLEANNHDNEERSSSTHQVLAHKSTISTARDFQVANPAAAIHTNSLTLRSALTARYKQDIRQRSHDALQDSLTSFNHAFIRHTLMIRNRLPRYYTVTSIMSTQQTTADVTAAGLSQVDQNINNTEEDRSHEARGHKANLSNPSVSLLRTVLQCSRVEYEGFVHGRADW